MNKEMTKQYNRLMNDSLVIAVRFRLRHDMIFRAHIRKLIREANRKSSNELLNKDFYVSITRLKNNELDCKVRSTFRDMEYFNDVDEYTIDCDMNDEIFNHRCKFDAEYIVLRETEELDAAEKYLRKLIRK